MNQQDPQRFHHRHLPNLTRWSKAALWKWAHLFFPMIIHYLTDKYEDRRHHLIVDTIYAVIVFVLVAVNLGIGAWYYLFLTPAEIDVQAYTPVKITSGSEMFLSIEYFNPNRDVENLAFDVYLPEGFTITDDGDTGVIEDTPQGQVVRLEAGNVEKRHFGVVEVSGTVFGSVGEHYTAHIVTSYTSAGRERFEAATHSFDITDSAFNMWWEAPKAVAYGITREFTLHYKNNSEVDRQDVQVDLDLPASFRITSIEEGSLQLAFSRTDPVITIPSVPAGSEGSLLIRGVFVAPGTDGLLTVVGDQNQPVSASITTTPIIDGTAVPEVSVGTVAESIEVIAPRLAMSLSGGDVVDFGEIIRTTATVTNIGDEPAENVTLRVRPVGLPVSTAGMFATVGGETVSATVDSTTGELVVPTGASLAAGESVNVSLNTPSAVIAGQEISSLLELRGTAEIPELEATIGIPRQQLTTKFNSRVDLTATALYYGPAGEELGYGPYPPRPWEVTAMRVVLRVDNENNPLTNVRVSMALPGQVEWTNLSSVSAGTTVEYDDTIRTVSWTIPRLAPNSEGYGAQFEVRLLPNHLQIGQRPHLANNMVITAVDAFTESAVYQTAPAVVLPLAISE